MAQLRRAVHCRLPLVQVGTWPDPIGQASQEKVTVNKEPEVLEDYVPFEAVGDTPAALEL